MTGTLTAAPDDPDEPPRRHHIRYHVSPPRPGTPGTHFHITLRPPPPDLDYRVRAAALRGLRRALDALIDADPNPATIDQVTAHVTRLTATLTGDDPTGDDVERAARRAALSGDIADLLRGHP